MCAGVVSNDDLQNITAAPEQDALEKLSESSGHAFGTYRESTLIMPPAEARNGDSSDDEEGWDSFLQNAQKRLKQNGMEGKLLICEMNFESVETSS